MNRAIIVVPWYREHLTDDERISLRHLKRYLGHREIVVLKPESLNGTLDNRPTESFADYYFESVHTYSRLLLSPSFYRRFDQYEWLFLYQLDALALADNLDDWLDAPWDYIGAPWLVDKDDPTRGFSRVGNGGFCLRRIDASLRVLEQGQGPSFLKGVFRTRLPDQRHTSILARTIKTLIVARQASRGVTWYADNYTLNEDHFWCDRAHLFGTGFSVAPLDRGIEFAFESAPREAFEQNGSRLPFGAHAWAKQDRAFWEPYLLGQQASAEALS